MYQNTYQNTVEVKTAFRLERETKPTLFARLFTKETRTRIKLMFASLCGTVDRF